MKKPKRKPDWLHGERDQQRIESTKEKWSRGGRVMSEEEAEEVTDANDKNWIECDAPYPEAQLNEALRLVQRLLAVLDPKRADLASPEREQLHQNLLSQGLSEEEAQRDCDKVSVRKDTTLRCARDSFDWLHQALWRAERGRSKITKALDSKDIDTVRVRAIEAQKDFVEAISYALNGGRALGELKPRVHHDTKPGSKKKPHRKGKAPLLELARAAVQRLKSQPKYANAAPAPSEVFEELWNDKEAVRRNTEGQSEYKCLTRWRKLPTKKAFASQVAKWRKEGHRL